MFKRHVLWALCVVVSWGGGAAAEDPGKEPAKPAEESAAVKPTETPSSDAVALAQARVKAAETVLDALVEQRAQAQAELSLAQADTNRTAEIPALTGKIAGLDSKLERARVELRLAQKALEDAPLAVVLANRSKAVEEAVLKVQQAQAAVTQTLAAITSNELALKEAKNDAAKKELKAKGAELGEKLKSQYAVLAQAQAALDDAQDARQGALALKTAQEMGVPASMPQIYKSLQDAQAELPAQYVFLQAGFLSLNPYRITGKEGGLVMETSGDADVRPYVEATFRHRTAWLDANDLVFADQSLPLVSILTLPLTLCGADEDCPVIRGLNKLLGKADLVPRDYEVRVGLVGGVGEDEASAPTVAGAGDGYVEGSVGWRLWTAGFEPRDSGNSGILRATFNLEALGGVTTDREFQDVHDFKAFGLATVWGIKNNKEEKSKHNTELVAGLYWGQLEVPQLAAEADIPDALKGQKVVVGRNGDIDFSNEDATLMRIDLHVPAGDEGYFIVSGRYWTGLADIEPWTLGVGYSMPIDGK